MLIIPNNDVGRGPTINSAALPEWLPDDAAPRGWTRVFRDDFRSGVQFSDSATQKSGWRRKFHHGANWLNDERQAYVTPAVSAMGVTYNPFSVQRVLGKDWLRIQGVRASAADQARTKQPFLSGMVSRYESITYGLVRATFMLQCTDGLWPAFWMLSEQGWPPEIDWWEWVTNNGPNSLFLNAHWRDSAKTGGRNSEGGDVDVPQPVFAPFTFTGVWTDQTIGYYFNGRLLITCANRPRAGTVEGIHQPMYPAIDLAMGGGWSGDPDQTDLPFSLFVTDVEMYQRS